MSARKTLTENGWLGMYVDDATGAWASIKYGTEPTLAQVEADGIAALTPPPTEYEVECEDGDIVP